MSPFEWAQESYKAICDGDYESTFIYSLDFIDDPKHDWALLMSYVIYDRDDEFVGLKLAYQSSNSIMSDYHVDWLMPWDDDSGEVWDTESEFRTDGSSVEDIIKTVGYLYNDARLKSQEFIDSTPDI